MHPIVVACPRSGSEILTDIIFNYSRQVWGSERCLQEFLLVTFFRDSNFSFEDNKIKGNYWTLPREQWENNWAAQRDKIWSISQQRIDWLKQNPNYVFKLITTPKITDEQYTWCLNNFNPIFVQRNDKIRSLLSYLFLPYIGLHHGLEKEEIKTQQIKIKFNKETADLWIWNFKKFNMLLEESKDKTLLTYEDLLTNNSVDEVKVLESLGWKIPSDYQFYKYTTKPTPYEDEDLLNYFIDREQVQAYLDAHKDILLK